MSALSARGSTASEGHLEPREQAVSRGDIVREALERGERDSRLLDGRDFDAAYWRNARRQLSVLLRDLHKAQDLNEAYRVSFTESKP